MNRGYTLIGVLIVVIILAVLAAISMPGFSKLVRRGELREIGGMLGAVRAGARHYEFKYQSDINTLPTTAPEYWEALNVEPPADAVCTYSIVNLGNPTKRWLQVNSSGDWLYRYELPEDSDPSDNKNTSNPDYRYIQYLP